MHAGLRLLRSEPRLHLHQLRVLAADNLLSLIGRLSNECECEDVVGRSRVRGLGWRGCLLGGPRRWLSRQRRRFRDVRIGVGRRGWRSELVDRVELEQRDIVDEQQQRRDHQFFLFVLFVLFVFFVEKQQ